jgi:hypothetical protein
MEASSGARHPASEWMPLQKLDEVERAERLERPDRFVVPHPKRRGMAV